MPVKPLRARAIALFRDTYGAAPPVAASAPGWVNLLGGHTDYNGGPVLAVATGERAVVAVGPADEGVVELISGADGRRERADLREADAPGWAACVGGVLRELVVLGATSPVGGVRIALASDLAPGAGVPPAVFAVAAVRALAALTGVAVTARRLAGVAFRSDQVGDGRGRGRGIMEHTLAALARPDHALLIECASAETQAIRLRGRLLLVDTGMERDTAAELSDRRRAECAAAVLRLKFELPELVWLASWPTGWLPRLKKALPEPLRSRVVHVVGETARTRFGAELLAGGKLKRFGELLYESHESCRRVFAGSTPEADLVVAAARRAGALGARLTESATGEGVIVVLGKGAGGRGKGETKVVQAIRRAFSDAYGREPPISPVRPSGGARLERVR